MQPDELLLALVKSECCPAPLPDEARAACTAEALEALYPIAKRQDMAHLVAAAIEKHALLAPSHPLFERYKQQQHLAILRCERIEYEKRQIYALFEENCIPFVPLKGAVIRSYYAKSWMRTSCDLDILVREEDAERAIAKLIEALQYRWDGGRNFHDYPLYSPSGVHLELHYNIGENDARLDPVLLRAFSYAEPIEQGKYEHRFSSEFFLFHLLAHASHHFKAGGCGMRPFMDLWLLRRAWQYDEAALHKLCDEAKLTRFYDAALRLSEVWFSDAAPDEASIAMQDYLLGSYLYGTLSNKVAIQQKKTGGKFGYALTRIFLPYRHMKYRYPILQKHPILTPFYEVVRWVELIFGGRLRYSLHELKVNGDMPREKREMLAALFEQVGL